jgi:hypothetical protein
MERRGFVKGVTTDLNYDTVNMNKTTWRVAHSIAWTGRGTGYIVQRVKRIKEERKCQVKDNKFAWLPWSNPTVVEYYEAWKMVDGRVFPRGDLKEAGKPHSKLDAPECKYDDRLMASLPAVPGKLYYHDTFSTTMGSAFEGNDNANKMIREAILGWVYFLPKDRRDLMVWYDKFKNVAKHYRMLPNQMTGGRLPVCLAREIEEPPIPPAIERKDLAVGWGHTLYGNMQAITGRPTKRCGFINLTSPHIPEEGLQLGNQASKTGFFANSFRHEVFRYEDLFNIGYWQVPFVQG